MRSNCLAILCVLIIATPLLAPIPSKAAQVSRTRDIAQRTLPSVVLLVIETFRTDEVNFGSGFFVAPDIVATNFHVVEGAVGGYARIMGQPTKYEILGFVGLDPIRDLALVKLKNVNGKPLSIGDSSALAIGDEVFAEGSPQGLEGTFSQGIVSSIRRSPENLIQITAAISHGSSGGPVLNMQGEVIGVAVGSVTEGQALNFAIPSSYLQSMLAGKKTLVGLSTALRDTAPDSAGSSNVIGGPNDGRPTVGAGRAPALRAKSPSLSTDEVTSNTRLGVLLRENAVTKISMTTQDSRSNGPRKEYTLTPENGRFGIKTEDRTRDGVADYVTIQFKGRDNSWSLVFTTFGLGRNLSYGTYANCQRAPFSEGTAGLEITGNSIGCNDLTGTFSIFDVQYDYSLGHPQVVSLTASFEQECSGTTVRGAIYINSSSKDVR